MSQTQEAALDTRRLSGVAKKPTPGGWFSRYRLEILLILPLVAYVLILTIAPILDTIRISLAGPRGADFPSPGNYSTIMKSPLFRTAVKNTVIVATVSLVLEMTIGLATALALNAKFKGRGFARTVALIPLGVPTIVSGAIMLLLFSRSGYLNSLLGATADLLNRIPGMDWAFAPLSWTVAGGFRTLLTVAVADMWKALPIVVLIFLAGLQSIPEDVYEAADVDGASKWQRFRGVTFPMLLPFLTMAIILRAIDAFRIFELALVLAGRIEPVLGTYIAGRYLPPTNDAFTAAAAAMVLFAMIMVFIVAYLKLVAGKEAIRG